MSPDGRHCLVRVACAALGILLILMALLAPGQLSGVAEPAAAMDTAAGVDVDAPEAVVVPAAAASPRPLFALSFPTRPEASPPAPVLPPPVPPPEA